MRISSFSRITFSILLLATMAFSIYAAEQPGGKTKKAQASVAKAPAPQAPREDYKKILDQRNQFKQEITELDKKNRQLMADNENIRRENQKLREIRSSSFPKNVMTTDYFDKKYQPPKEPDMRGMIIAVSCVGGVIFLLLVISTLVILFVFMREKRKSLRKEDIQDLLSTSFSGFSEEQEKSRKEIIENLPSIDGISSSVVANLKGQFNNLDKKLNNPTGAKDISDILTIVKSMQEGMQKELETLRSQAQSVESQKAELQPKIAEAERKSALAQKTIDDFEEEKARAVEAVKTDMQTLMQKQLMAEQAKGSAALQKQSAAVKEQQDKIQQLTRECAELNIKAAKADSAGYERGLNSSQEKTEALVRENEKLSSRLQNELEKNKKSELEFQQKLSDLQEKVDESKRTQIQSQAAQKANEENFKREFDRLTAALSEKTNEVASAAQQKNEIDSKVRDLQDQVRQFQNELRAAQHKVQEAESRERESVEQMKQLQVSVSQITEEKDSLDRKLADSNSTIRQLTEEKASMADSIHAAERKITDLQAAIYPSEFIGDKDFSDLKAHLDAWVSERISGAEIIKSALGLFSQRASLNEDTWFQALRNISLGISQTLRAKNQTPAEVVKELVLWSRFLMKFSDENFDFSLKIPNLGEVYNESWMTAKSSRNTKVVDAVITWAVWHNQYGVRHNAEVE